MEAPEYLDLDEIDFSDDSVVSGIQTVFLQDFSQHFYQSVSVCLCVWASTSSKPEFLHSNTLRFEAAAALPNSVLSSWSILWHPWKASQSCPEGAMARLRRDKVLAVWYDWHLDFCLWQVFVTQLIRVCVCTSCSSSHQLEPWHSRSQQRGHQTNRTCWGPQ